MICCLVVWAVVLVTVLLCDLRLLSRTIRGCQLVTLCVSTALLLKTLAELDVSQLWSLIRPDLSRLSDLKTWSSAVVLAGVSTNLNTGAILTLPIARSEVSSSLVLSLGTHLVACLVFTVCVVPMVPTVSQAEGNLFVLITESVSSPVWCQAAFALISVLGLCSVLSTISVSVTFLHQNYQAPSRLYPVIVGIITIAISCSLFSFWSWTSAYSSELTLWVVERLSFLVQIFILATIGWIVSLDNIIQRQSRGGGRLGGMFTCYALTAPVALLLLAVLIFSHDIHKRDLTVGTLALVVMLSCILIPSIVVITNKLRQGKKQNWPWKEIWGQNILGRNRIEVRDGPADSYHKFERCDQTFDLFARMNSVRKSKS